MSDQYCFYFSFLWMNKKMNIMKCCILNYDDNLFFVIFYIKMSCIIVFPKNIESVISCYFMSQFWRQSKNYINFDFLFQSTKPPFLWYLLVTRQGKTHANVYKLSKLKFTHQLFYQQNFNLSSHCQQVSTSIGCRLRKLYISCYFSVNPNKSVHPTSLQNTNCI